MTYFGLNIPNKIVYQENLQQLNNSSVIPMTNNIFVLLYFDDDK